MEGLFSDYEAIRKSGLFDPEHYATAYPDVAERNVDPLVHYLEEGAREGRDPHPDFDTAFYLEQCRARGEEPANPLLHYLLIGAARGFQIQRDGKTPEVTEAPGIAAKPQILVAVESLGVAGTAGGTIEPLLTVSTEDGEIGRRPLRVDIPPQQVEIPAVDPRDGEPAETALFDRPPMELFIDEAVVAPDGLLRVEGWVVCLVQIETVEVFVAGERIGQAEFGRVREDVEHVRPDYPNARFSGFKLVSDIGRLGAGDK